MYICCSPAFPASSRLIESLTVTHVLCRLDHVLKGHLALVHTTSPTQAAQTCEDSLGVSEQTDRLYINLSFTISVYIVLYKYVVYIRYTYMQ